MPSTTGTTTSSVRQPARRAARGTDPASGVIGIAGGTAAIAGFVVLVVRAASDGTGGAAFVVGVALYGACLIYRFTMSAVASFAGRRGALGVLDEAGSFFLPAGTMMPVAFSFLDGALRWTLFGLAWAYAIVGFLLYLALLGGFRRYAVSVGYLFFFMVLPLIGPVRAALGEAAFGWLFAGGAVFAFGLLFRGKRSFPYADALWNAVALAGASLQYAGLSSL